MRLIFLIIQFPLFWGFHAHKIINRHAVYTLPEEMSGFYKSNIEYLEESSVNADIRKYSDKREAKKHYIDLEYYTDADSYDSLLSLPLDSIKSAYSPEDLNDRGILPWSLNICYLNLIKAFKEKNGDLILKYSSDLGHYVADAHVPLHTTKNYNGQLSDQHGIHALWETQVPESYSMDYILFTRRARYIEDVRLRIKEIILTSHRNSKKLLEIDRILRADFSKSEIYQTDQKGNYLQKRYSAQYVKRFREVEGENIEIQMRMAIETIGDLWLTAWINAGQPKLKVPSNRKKKDENNITKTTKIIGQMEEREHN